MPQIRQDEFDSVLEALEGDDVQTIHISGQPGVGKSTFIQDLVQELPTSYRTLELYVREGNSPTTFTQEILHKVRGAVGTISAIRNQASGGSIGLAGIISGGISTDNRARHLHKLAELSESVKAWKPVLLLIDDIHKLDERDITRDYLRELSTNLGDNVHLITAGRLRYEDADLNIHLETFTRDETAEYLRQEYSEVEPETIDELYGELEGHPYYLGLLTEAADSGTTLEIPEEDSLDFKNSAFDFIERAYLDSMTEGEEEFIRKTSGLIELDADICSAVLEDVSHTGSRRVLDSLSSKTVVSEVGRSDDTGDRVFKVHDLFQRFLYQQLDDPDELHRKAFQYYARRLYDAVEDSEVTSLGGLAFGFMMSKHLGEIYDGEPETQNIREEVDQLELEPQERFRFMVEYSPYVPKPQEQSSELIALELGDYVQRLRDQELDEGEKLWIEILGITENLIGINRLDANIESNEQHIDPFESSIQQIDEIDAKFLDEEQSNAQFITDMLRLVVYALAYMDNEDGESNEKHLNAVYDLLEKYGLNRTAAEDCINNCRNLAGEVDASGQAEDMIISHLEESFDQLDQNNTIRSSLFQLQADFDQEVMKLITTNLDEVIPGSDRLLEFVHDCGESLGEADNPFFAAAWYSFAVSIYQRFAPEAQSTKDLETISQHYTELREEYEENLDNPIFEIEEFDVQNIGLPELN